MLFSDQIRRVFAAPVSTDDGEREFMALWLRRSAEAAAEVGLRIAVWFGITALLIVPLFIRPVFRPIVIGTHVAIAATAGSWWLGLRRRGVSAVAASMTTQVVIAILYALITRKLFTTGPLEQSRIFDLALIVAVYCFMVVLTPFFDGRASLMTLAFAAIVGFAVIDQPVAHWWWLILVLSMAGVGLVHRGLAARAKRIARQEYRARLQFAPRSLVRRSSDAARDLEEVFLPKMRACICISAEWTTEERADDRLQRALHDFYAACDGILAEVAPAGRYFTDWIGGELFIVLYADEGLPFESVVDAAVRFGAALLDWKKAGGGGVAARLDIGLAGGSALIGMMGPRSSRKATAIGEVGGRARRLSMAGTLLRQSLGDADRAVLGGEVRDAAGSGWILREGALPPNARIKDLEEERLCYLEAAARQVAA